MRKLCFIRELQKEVQDKELQELINLIIKSILKNNDDGFYALNAYSLGLEKFANNREYASYNKRINKFLECPFMADLEKKNKNLHKVLFAFLWFLGFNSFENLENFLNLARATIRKKAVNPKEFLREKQRSPKVAGALGGYAYQTLFKQLIRCNRGETKYLRNKLYYRILLNINDEILSFFMDDKNFNGFYLKTLDKKE